MKIIINPKQNWKFKGFDIRNKNYAFNLLLEHFDFSRNLYKEWEIWSRCFGNVMIINGPSSSGKTTFSKYLGEFGFNIISLDDIFYECYFDLMCQSAFCISDILQEKLIFVKTFIKKQDLPKFIDGFKIEEKNYTVDEIQVIKEIQSDILEITKHTRMPSSIEIMSCVYDNAKEFLFSGRDVVIDVLFPDSSSFELLSFAFRYYPMTNVLLYSSLEDNLKKCLQRNYCFVKELSEDYRYPSQVISQYNDFYKFVPAKDHTLSNDLGACVDIIGLKQILEVVEYCEHRLVDIIQYRSITELVSLNSSHILKRAITMLKVLMADSEDCLLVVPKVKYDYIFNTTNLTKLYARNALTNKDMLSIDSIGVLSNTDVRALIYKNDGTLPSIVGSHGKIVEYEFLDGVLYPFGEQNAIDVLGNVVDVI